MREMFKNFTAQGTEVECNDGATVVNVYRMTPDFIAEQLEVASDEAQAYRRRWLAKKWIEPERSSPRREDRALSQHFYRQKLPRGGGSPSRQVLDWADRTNAAADARVKVKTIRMEV